MQNQKDSYEINIWHFMVSRIKNSSKYFYNFQMKVRLLRKTCKYLSFHLSKITIGKMKPDFSLFLVV